tara:strand:- start:1131 stop:1748 length:618 start_codon:yes stop_codon:yes gene_type:complete
MVSETEYLVDLLESNWDAAIAALKTTGGGNASIEDVHAVHPIIMDIRSYTSGKSVDAQGRSLGGNRINSASKKESAIGGIVQSRDVIVIMETGNTINYPTLMWDIRDETYNMSISIRTRQDDRFLSDDTRVSPQGTFGIERIQSLYLLVRYIVEQKRRGWLKNASQIYENVNQIMLGDRTESNDKKNRIFGYKVSIVMKKLARPI